jgi:lipoprotein-releasing system ATP-binding protein
MNEQVTALTLKDVRMDFRQGKAAVLHVLNGVNLTVKAGETVGLVGPSGSGKSTLLHIAGLLETPTSGDVIIHGRKVSALSDDARTEVRRKELGFVYQFHHLLPEFSALENIMLPQLIAGVGKTKARARAFELLRRVGLADRASHRPAELSGGEQQRVAIMRALANGPKILLADEPTGNLDQTTAGHVMMELLRLAAEEGVALLIATHDMAVAARLHRVMQLRDGILYQQS